MARTLLGVDVGGSSIKGGVVDVTTGELVGELVSVATPQPATPQAMIPAIGQLAAQLSAPSGPIGLCFPSVVKQGRIRTAANIDRSWLGIDGAALVAQALHRPVVFLNDADAAGLAEMRWGAGRGVDGPAVMVTLGTGIGSALFIGGRLFPNTELGHLEMRGMDAEKWASAHVRTALGLDFPAWCARVNEYLERLNALLWPDVFVIGGAVTEHFAEFAPLLKSEAEIRVARFGGQAGVAGAALAAAGEA
ncbi:MAG: polyphosphate--glucose phosphotransferase [Steroidobacteraceae bacterium]